MHGWCSSSTHEAFRHGSLVFLHIVPAGVVLENSIMIGSCLVWYSTWSDAGILGSTNLI